MNRTNGIWITVLIALVTVTIPGWSGAQVGKYSGTVIAVDRAAGTIVVEGMGPWQIKDGVTQLRRRTIAIMPSTRFVRLERATGPAPSGWIGDFVESELAARQVSPGDWVTVTLGAEDRRPTAVRIDVWQPRKS
jgi:hypothetical protein